MEFSKKYQAICAWIPSIFYYTNNSTADPEQSLMSNLVLVVMLRSTVGFTKAVTCNALLIADKYP